MAHINVMKTFSLSGRYFRQMEPSVQIYVKVRQTVPALAMESHGGMEFQFQSFLNSKRYRGSGQVHALPA